ncbi:MAG: hypothetical protein P8J87_08830, partial [Verrucomicrobiales bacterium]|nr:hypothetical protein [Verrucomicrobiales bacterium]
MAGKSKSENHRPRRRWRVIRTTSVILAVAVLLIAVAATVVYQRRVEFINRYLATSNLPFEASIGTL